MSTCLSEEGSIRNSSLFKEGYVDAEPKSLDDVSIEDSVGYTSTLPFQSLDGQGRLVSGHLVRGLPSSPINTPDVIPAVMEEQEQKKEEDQKEEDQKERDKEKEEKQKLVEFDEEINGEEVRPCELRSDELRGAFVI